MVADYWYLQTSQPNYLEYGEREKERERKCVCMWERFISPAVYLKIPCQPIHMAVN